MTSEAGVLSVWASGFKLGDEALNAAWQAYRGTKSLEARNCLMEHYLPTVKYCCEWLHGRLPSEVELDDVISAGIDGLRHAIRSFDPAREVQFETYLVARVRGAVLDYLRSIDWVPRLVRARATKLARIADTLNAKLGRTPTLAELARHTGITETQVRRALRDAEAAHCFSLDRCTSTNPEGRDVRDGDLVEDPQAVHPATPIQNQLLKDLLIKGLSTTERQVVILYYYEQMTMREIGATLDLSESRVSQMHSAIVDRLRARLNGREMEFGPLGH
jgi:RNA polymerase sigma factor for flagellar operon FliA